MLEKPSGDDGGSKKKEGLRLTLVRGGQKNDAEWLGGLEGRKD